MIRRNDRIRIREAMIISESFGERIWQGINNAPFALLLVTDSLEFLVNHPSPSVDFTALGHDSTLGTEIFVRGRTFNRDILATFPAIGGINTIVVGTPENTRLNSCAWLMTVIHEHFHQYVDSHPGFYDAVNKLDLSGGDRTGMWMLDYPFPYHDSIVGAQYSRYASTLATTVYSIGTDSFDAQVQCYASERRKFKSLLKPADYRYFSFQVWKEGIARYTEYKFLQLLETLTPSTDLAQLPDFVPFPEYHRQLFKQQTDRMNTWTLKDHQRDCFYAIGLGEGLILDQLNPGWRERYLTEKFFVEQYSEELK